MIAHDQYKMKFSINIFQKNDKKNWFNKKKLALRRNSQKQSCVTQIEPDASHILKLRESCRQVVLLCKNLYSGISIVHTVILRTTEEKLFFRSMYSYIQLYMKICIIEIRFLFNVEFSKYHREFQTEVVTFSSR